MAKLIRSTLTDQIFDYLKSQIMEGAWKPGEKIPSEIELAENLGVSRMSLRNAIKKSNILGLTETRVGEGTFVRQFNMRSYIKELYSADLLTWDALKVNDFRYLLQCGSIRFALESEGVDEELPQLCAYFNDMEEAAGKNDMEAFHHADMKFHRHICRMSQNDLLYMIYDAIEALLDDLIQENVNKSITTHGNLNFVLEHHRDLLEGLRKHDLALCEEALDASRKRSFKYYPSSGEPG